MNMMQQPPRTESEMQKKWEKHKTEMQMHGLNVNSWPEITKSGWEERPEPVKSWPMRIPGFSPHLKVPQKGLMTIVGPPEGGKSTFARRLLFDLAYEHGVKVGLTCLEEEIHPRTSDVLRKMYSGKFVKQMDEEEIFQADEWIHGQFTFITKPENLMDGWRFLDIVEHLFQLREHPSYRKAGCDVVCLDPFNELDHSWDKRSMNRTEYTGCFLMELKHICDKYHKLAIVCVHPPIDQIRAKRMRSKGIPEVYDLSDCADSAHFYNKSDIGLGVWFNKNIEQTVANICKIKNRESCGTLGHSYPWPLSMEFNYANEGYVVRRSGAEVFEDD